MGDRQYVENRAELLWNRWGTDNMLRIETGRKEKRIERAGEPEQTGRMSLV
jgi:hypothetical protein